MPIRWFPLLRRCAAGLPATVLAASLALGSEGELADVYKGVVFPYHKNGNLVSEVHAATADGLGLTDKNPRIRMGGVIIYVYDTQLGAGETEAYADDAPPPLKMTIVADEGYYERRPAADGRAEDVAQLQKNVRVFRYEYIPDGNGGQKRVLHTRVDCDNAAWNHAHQILSGEGPVTIIQPGSTLRGTDFVYHARREAEAAVAAPDPVTSSRPRSENRWGGVFELDHDVTMVLDREAAQRLLKSDEEKTKEAGEAKPAKPAEKAGTNDPAMRTVIRCAGLASYSIDAGQVHFQQDVLVERQGLTMKSQFMRVFLYRDDEQQHDRPIREIVAWSEVNVERRPAGGDAQQAAYVARGDYARYLQETETLVLTDKREGKRPVVEVGGDTITDRLITFDTRDDRMNVLIASGGAGEASLHGLMLPATPNVQPAPTVIKYKNQLIYDRDKNQATFTGSVSLKREGLDLTSDVLRVDLLPEEQQTGGNEPGVRQLVAEGNVLIRQGLRISHANRAELDAEKKVLRLFGPPSPQVEEVALYKAEATEIRTIQFPQPAGASKYFVDGQGPGICIFVEARKEQQPGQPQQPENAEPLAVAPDAVTIHFDEKMIIDETGRFFTMSEQDELQRNFVRFTGNVVSISRDYVLNSELLDVILEENAVKAADNTVQQQRSVASISAHGNATLHWGRRHCKGARIVRDMRKSVIVIYGDPAANIQAEVWEEDGKRFEAPVIVATADGQQIQARGPGVLALPDDEGDKVARVHYTGSAVYVRVDETHGQVTFRDGVRMVRDDMTVTGDVMVAYLEETQDPAAAAGIALATPEGQSVNPHRLTRITVDGNVVVTQPTRVAEGLHGEVILLKTGDLITLKGDDKRNADVRDADGVHLISPIIEANQGRRLVTAQGPGIVYISSLEHVGGKRDRTSYRLDFADKGVYNELARKIKFHGNVRLRQSNVNGRSDQMELILLEEKEAFDTEEDRPAVRVKEVFASGRTQFQRFEPGAADVAKAVSDRPGRTVFTQSQDAHYDVEKHLITLSGGPPRPTALQQIVYEEGGQLKRTRDQMWADVLQMDVDTGRMWGPRAKIQRETVSPDGPMGF